MRKANFAIPITIPFIAAGLCAGQTQPSCEKLKSLSLRDTTITMAEAVGAGNFSPPSGPAIKDLPAFCRVAAILTPSKDSEIKIEVWLPEAGWNGKYLAVGNGGWSGAIGYPALSKALAQGYATASTDTGHSGGSGSFALGHPEKLIDFAYRSVHEMTVKGKAIIAAYYGDGPTLSYWNGCSSGGKQGLKEAQRFPADYDGIIAGAPANYWTHLVTGSLWIAQAVHKDEASYIPASKYPLIHKAVLEACDAMDGVKDGVIEDPARCRFDPKILECKTDDSAACLTPPQGKRFGRFMRHRRIRALGRRFFQDSSRGARWGGADWRVHRRSRLPRIISNTWCSGDPAWDWRTLNFDTDVALADKTDDGMLNATDPDLKAFIAHGGKLLMYHGWTDQLIPPQNSINYYRSVPETLKSSVRLFMVPGMNHCAGGEGTSNFDAVGAMEQWVEQKKAPERIAASHIANGAIDRTRPLCPYPQVAQYKGSGSTNEAANFVCK